MKRRNRLALPLLRSPAQTTPIGKYLAELELTPDDIYTGTVGDRCQPTTTFIVADFNLDGQYEVYTAPGTKSHQFLMHDIWVMKRQVETPKDGQPVLPIVLGRTGLVKEGQDLADLLAFWASRYDIGHYLPHTYPQDAYAGGAHDRQVTPEFLRETIIPLLVSQKVVHPAAYWWSGQAQFMGQIRDKSDQKEKSPTKTYVVDGQPHTRAELMSMLHAGTAQQRQTIRQWVCDTTEPEFSKLKDSLKCEQARPVVRQPRVNPMGPGGVEFRSQESLNRAWKTMVGRRRRAGVLTPEQEHIKQLGKKKVNPDDFYSGEVGWGATTFILADLDLDGKYEVYQTGGMETHARLMAKLRQEGKIQQANPEQTILPLIAGRTGIDYFDKRILLAFWATRWGLAMEANRYYTEEQIKQQFAPPNTVYTPEFLETNAIPLLLEAGIITPNTIWWDADMRCQGTANGDTLNDLLFTGWDGQEPPPAPKLLPEDVQLLRELGIPADSLPKSVTTATYTVDGQTLRLPALIGLLHFGTPQQKEQVRQIICRSPELEQFKGRAECDQVRRPQRQPRINPIRPEGVEFRSQNSLNRAWKTMVGRRRRLAHKFINAFFTDVQLANNPPLSIDPKESTMNEDELSLHMQYLAGRLVNPDYFYTNRIGKAYETFIVADFNLDGQYETYRGSGRETHQEMMWSIYEDKKIQKPSPDQQILPMVFGRTGIDRDNKQQILCAFWGGRPDMRFKLNNNGYSDQQIRQALRSPMLNASYIKSHVLPVMIRDWLITPDTLWWDQDSKFQGRASEPTQPDEPTETRKVYQFEGQPHTMPELMAILHAGNSEQRQRVTEFICGSTEPELQKIKDQIQCGRIRRPVRQPRLNPIGPGGVEFRNQKSLNRAWDAMRSGRKAKLSKRMLEEFEGMRLTPDKIFFSDAFGPEYTLIIADFNHDGKYECYESYGEEMTHADMLEKMKGTVKTPPPGYVGLPIITARTGTWYDEDEDKTFQLIAFWGVRQDLTGLLPHNYPNEAFGYGEQITTDYIRRFALPTLLKNNYIQRDTLWWGVRGDFQGEVGGAVAAPRRRKKAPALPPEPTYNLNGKQLTQSQLLSMLHTGTPTDKQSIRNLICQSSDDPKIRDMVGCDQYRQPVRSPRINPIRPDGVEFRSQNSLNRAWKTMTSARRAALRAKLLRGVS